jgi:hypothetical protein
MYIAFVAVFFKILRCFFQFFLKKYWRLKFTRGFETVAKSPANSKFFPAVLNRCKFLSLNFFPTSFSGSFKPPQFIFLKLFLKLFRRRFLSEIFQWFKAAR